MLDSRTLLYLATDGDRSGPWIYSMDVERRVSHRISSGAEKYASLAASADGHRLVATVANPRSTLWRVPLSDKPVQASAATRITLTTRSGFSPRLGRNALLYVSSTAATDSIWKLADDTAGELWTAPDAHIIDGPAMSYDGRYIAFSTEEHGRTRLYVVNADGSQPRVVTESLNLRSAPAWAPDDSSLTVSADDHSTPRLFKISMDGRSIASITTNYAAEPVWAPDGRAIVYSGPDIGTTFPIEAVTSEGMPYPLLKLVLTRGARHLRFLPGGRSLVALDGEVQHKNLWLIDLDTGRRRQLTDFASDFVIRDFDISPDGRELVFDRVQENSDVVLLDLPAH
jgi:Tol biopolymer transport system component